MHTNSSCLSSPRVSGVVAEDASARLRIVGCPDVADVSCAIAFLEEIVRRPGPYCIFLDLGSLDYLSSDLLVRVASALYSRREEVLQRVAGITVVLPSARFWHSPVGQPVHLDALGVPVRRFSDVATAAAAFDVATGTLKASNENSAPPDGFAAPPSPVEQLRSYLLEHVAEASVNGAASALRTSRRTLQRVLQQEQTTFRQLLLWARIERAKALLSETNLRMGDISLRVGLRKSERLSQLFRQELAMTPRQWRSSIGTTLASARRNEPAAPAPVPTPLRSRPRDLPN